MKKYRFLTKPALICAISTLTSCAGTNQKAAPSLISDADTNRAGRLSKAEYSQARLQRAFNKLDVNRDDKVTLDEWKQFDTSPKAETHFRMLDENGDQYISVAEFLKLAPKHSNLDQVTASMDQNADDALSDEELKEEPTVKLFLISF
jgi:Ca2+-binding EF-hand superfamily protein